jgi:hypothetical protein
MWISATVPATVSATATRATWQVHPTNENASSGQTKCITIRLYMFRLNREEIHFANKLTASRISRLLPE